MDILLTVLYCLIVLSVLVFIHEGGHFLAARMFGVRVTEFMLGLPGPRLSFKHGETRFGVTCILLGGYAKVCGMEAGNIKPYLAETLQHLHTNGKSSIAKTAQALSISKEDAENALDELVEWGAAVREKNYNSDKDYVYSAADINGYKLGEPREVIDKEKYFKTEFFKQYRSLSFLKRSLIILAGIIVNILFAMLMFIILYSIIGMDITDPETGNLNHILMSPLDSITFGLRYVWAVIWAVLGLLNPATMQDTVSNSTSLIGIAVISKSAAEQGLWTFLQFMAMISVSLGIMNLLPIPPLDGGRFVIEIIQAITKKNIPERVISSITMFGIGLFLLLFIILTNQDISRFVLGS